MNGLKLQLDILGQMEQWRLRREMTNWRGIYPVFVCMSSSIFPCIGCTMNFIFLYSSDYIVFLVSFFPPPLRPRLEQVFSNGLLGIIPEGLGGGRVSPSVLTCVRAIKFQRQGRVCDAIAVLPSVRCIRRTEKKSNTGFAS
jgi:hypothetical protein